MSKPLFYGKQHISQSDVDAVLDTLQSDFLTQGPKVQQFEEALRRKVGASYAVACANGTAALHLACLSLGIGAGDEVWVPAISFVASANCALYTGAKVSFLDVEPHSGNLCIESLSKKLSTAAEQDSLPKALVVVHMAGLPCDMQEIASLCRKHNIAIIEDAAHALGSTYNNHPVGACQYSDIVTFSFHPVKSITSAEGGMVLTNNSELAQKLRTLCSHGISKTNFTNDTQYPSWYYEQQELGFNYRLSDLHAALGLSQLSKLDDFVNQRQALVRRYKQALPDLTWQHSATNGSNAFHLAIAFFERGKRDHAYLALKEHNIHCQLHYMPIYRQPYHDIGAGNYPMFPGAENYFATALSLPLFPDLTHDDQDRVIEAVKELL